MKGFLFLTSMILITSLSTSGQGVTDSFPITKPEKIAEFKGGVNGWLTFLQNNLDRELLPKAGAPNGTYRAIANFIIDSLGRVSDINIEADPGYGTAEELKRILNLSSGKWVPAFDKGKNVSYRKKQSLTLNH